MTEIFRHVLDLPGGWGPSVVTIGNFDGVHCGHRAVIAQVTERARALHARSVLVTLHPHPAEVLRPQAAPKLLTPLPQKLALLRETGLDAVLVLPFSESYAQTTALHFAETVLRDGLHAVEVHEGENFRFGSRAEADMHSLESMGAAMGFSAHIYAPLHIGREVVSSSRVRSMVASGDMTGARHLLGRPFAVESTPARGRGYGTRYTVPTINLAEYRGLLPGNGVYVAEMRVGAGAEAVTFDGVTNVGNRPTFGADSFSVETYLFRFREIDLSEQTPLQLTFLRRLREERRWPSPEALKAQIGIDVARAERWFSLRQMLRLSRHTDAGSSRSEV